MANDYPRQLTPNTFVSLGEWDGTGYNYRIITRYPEPYAYRYQITGTVAEGHVECDQLDYRDTETLNKLEIDLAGPYATETYPLFLTGEE